MRTDQTHALAQMLASEIIHITGAVPDPVRYPKAIRKHHRHAAAILAADWRERRDNARKAQRKARKKNRK